LAEEAKMKAERLGGATPRWPAVPLLALLAGLLALGSGWGAGAEQSLRHVRDGLRTHAASGDIAIVEIDARSLREMNIWPWPRRYHAAMIDRLNAAGATLIAFDVNFEAPSNPADDGALVAAMERAGGMVALPTFRQQEQSGSSETVDTLPHNMFRDYVFIASVNVFPDADGLVRRMPLGISADDAPRPSMAALLAEADGDIDQLLEIDFAIDRSTIPRFSFIDIVEGRFDPAAVAGKRLIVGGTAADMQDRYAVPRYGVIPGVEVLVLGAETILAGGVPATRTGLWPLLLALLIAVAAALPGRPLRSVAVLVLGIPTVLALPLATEQWLSATYPIVPALAALAVTALGTLLLQISARHRRHSMVDGETLLPNLRAMNEAAQGDARTIIVARIDRFEALAAALGPAGTAALVQRVAERLAGETGETVYRTDEHSLAWFDPAGAAHLLDDRLSGITAAMRAPVECGRMVDVTLGLGIASPCEAEAGEPSARKQQIANAALAAERALRDRRPYLYFADANDDETGWHLSLVGELGAAMAAGEVWNAYQPKLDIRTGQVCGVETLVRWTHRERGPVGPDRFIPVVEANGRADDLTRHVFAQALADAARWRAAGHALGVAVNVSATLLDNHGFIGWLRETLQASPVAAEMVTIEVTESAAVRNVDQAAAALAEWRALGVQVSIDDYGTGQSSLGYLQRLPAGELKIDMSFVQDMVHDSRNAIMVRSTVALAHQLGMKVVAEGVEDAATLALLGEVGCDVAQGWLIGRPMNAAALEEYLKAPAAPAALAA